MTAGLVEDGILWIEPAARDWPFVREATLFTPRRRGPPPHLTSWRRDSGRRWVAIAELTKEGHRDCMWRFERRAWYINEADFAAYARDGLVNSAPCEGVIPSSIVHEQPSALAFPILSKKPVPAP